MTAVVKGAALLILAGLQAYWLSNPYLSWALALVHLVFVGVAVWRPGVSLLVLATVGPVITTLAAVAGSPYTGARHLEAMVLAVIAGAVWQRRSGEATRTGRAALVFGVIALASAASVYPTRLLTFEFSGMYFVRSPFWDPLFFGMLAAEGAALVWSVETLARRDQGLIRRAIIATLVGHAGAAALTLRELLDPASRSADAVVTFLQLFVNVRTHSQYDVNAAASALVVVILASIGVMNRVRSVVLLPAVLCVLAGLWQTGSRVAMVALVVAALTALAVSMTRLSRRKMWIGAGAAVALVSLAAAVFYAYPGRRNINLGASINSRRALTETGLRMVTAVPVTGIGIGRFQELSAEYGSSDISGILGVSRTNDNAHNNFVQVAAALGIVGLSAFVWLLYSVMSGAIRGWRARLPTEQWTTVWVTTGLAGSMVTWLTGHPLLVPEYAYVFWVAAGLAAAGGGVSTPRTATKWGVVLIVVAVIASVPWQASGQRDREELQHIGTGVSMWQDEVDGERYRIADTQSTVFVPTGHTVILPVRLDPSTAAPVSVAVWVDGERVNELEVTSTSWTPVRFSILPARRRFVEVRLTATQAVTFWIGRADSRPLN